MPDPIKLELGDPCPACHGDLRPALVPTDAELVKSRDRENPIVLPPTADTASAEVRADLGALYRCGVCGYSTRFKDVNGHDDGDQGDDGADGEAPKPPKRKARR